MIQLINKTKKKKEKIVNSIKSNNFVRSDDEIVVTETYNGLI